jgi:hypothetical protein
MAYANADSAGNNSFWFGGEDPTSALQKRAWGNQMAADNAAAGANWDANRELHERNLQNQEQGRRAYDSETARLQGTQKYGVLSSLLSQAPRW